MAVLDPVTVTLGSCLSSRYGLVLDVHPDEPLAGHTRAVRTVIRSVRGPAADVYEPGVPHMSLAYATGAGDSGQAQSALRRVRPSHTSMTITSLALVDVALDHARTTMTWRHLATLPLAAAAVR